LMIKVIDRLQKSDDPDAKECFVQVKRTSELKSQIFVDMEVYTHQRCFRMYKCTKMDANRPLEIDIDNLFPLPDMDEDIFKLTVVNGVGPEIPILEVKDEELLRSAIPSGASKRKMERNRVEAKLMEGWPKENSIENATHFEFKKKPLYFRVDDTTKLYKAVADSIETHKIFYIHEIMTPITRFVLELQDISPLGLQDNKSTYKWIQETIAKLSNGSSSHCIILKCAKRTHWLLFPLLLIERDNANKYITAIREELNKVMPTVQWKHCITNIYSKKEITMLGAENRMKFKHEKKNGFTVSLLGIYDMQGNIQKEKSTEILLQECSVRITNENKIGLWTL